MTQIRPRWMRWLGLAALGAGLSMGVACGGMTITFGTPTPDMVAPTEEVDLEATVIAMLTPKPDTDDTAQEATTELPEEVDVQATVDYLMEQERERATLEAVRLTAEAGTNTPPTVAPTVTPPPPPTHTPTATRVVSTATPAIPYGVVTAPVSVNVRSGPDTEYVRLRTSSSGSRHEISGRSVDGEWWQVRIAELPGGVGWISADYLNTFNTADIPVVSAPPLPTAAPTSTPTSTPAPVAGVRLDFSGTPRYGSRPLTADGTTNTVDISMNIGGSIAVSEDPRLPGTCRGSVRSTSPDIRIEWSGGDLAIYFRPSPSLGLTSGTTPDTTLIVNRADSSWVCNDDGFSNSYDPLVFISNAPPGIYDIWVGRFGGGQADGKLIFGEFRPQ